MRKKFDKEMTLIESITKKYLKKYIYREVLKF